MHRRALQLHGVRFTGWVAASFIAAAACSVVVACGGADDNAATSSLGAGGATPTGAVTTVDLEVSGQGTVTIAGHPAEAPVECAAAST